VSVGVLEDILSKFLERSQVCISRFIVCLVAETRRLRR